MAERKTLQDLTIKDNFMFGAVMMDEEICRELLELVLGFRIAKVTVSVNNGELVPSARFNCTTLPKQEYRLAGWLYRSATALCQRCEPLFR